MLLFDFSQAATASAFHPVDDRIMGGVSQSAMRSEDGFAVFCGELSTERGGGFASVRSALRPVDLSDAAGLQLRVRGDGREYRMRLRTRGSPEDLSYLASFTPPAGQWDTIELTFEAFRATTRGRLRPDAPPLDPAAIDGFGLLVADPRTGAFELALAWIRSFGA